MKRIAEAEAGLVLAAVVLAGCAPDPHTERRRESSAVLEASVPDDATPGCSAAVGIDGEVVWAAARGLANAETGAALETSTRMDIASTSKQFTAMSVLMLVDRGELSLDDVLSERLDGMPDWADDVTLRDLLHHTAGVRDFLGAVIVPESGHVTSADVLEWVRTSGSSRGVGSFRYSNAHYNLLAAVVVQATGAEFAEWMQEEVFGPLDIDARIWPAGEGDAANHHRRGDADFGVTEIVWADEGSGGILISPSDLVLWAGQLREPTLVSAETLEAALADTVRVDADRSYGPGLIFFSDGAIGHGGDGEGGNSGFVVSPDRRTAIAVVCNQEGLSVDAIEKQLAEIWFAA